MTACLLLGDVHLADDARRPTSRKIGYEQQILDKLQFCVETANDLNLPLIQNGDMFHLKASSKNSHRLVQRTHELFKEVNQGVWIVPGNHDMAHDRIDSLNAQPLGALCRMSNVNFLIGETIDLPGICGVPYITEFDGGDWRAALSAYNYFGMTSPELVVTHAPIFPAGQQPGVYASISADDWAQAFSDVAATNYGHIHTPHFQYKDSKNSMVFANFGAISRGSLHEEAVNRVLQIATWTGSTFESIALPCLPPEEVFLFAEAAKIKENRASARDFAAALGSTKLQALTIESVYDKLRGEVSDKKVLEIIEEILEDVQ